MASWSVDKSGRFPQRLFLRAAEIDRDCERLVTAFLQDRHGEVRFPLSTDDLTVLVEQHSSSLDQYADLSDEGDDVEGMTCFLPGQLPQILISAQLTEQANRQNRLRTTLAHELGHAFYHRAVFDHVFAAPPHMFEAARAEPRTVCKRDSMMGTTEFDWLEWQAGYVSGAILMPAQQVRRSVGDLLRNHGIHGAAVIGTAPAAEAERHVTASFQVSGEAARVRLRKLGLLADSEGPPHAVRLSRHDYAPVRIFSLVAAHRILIRQLAERRISWRDSDRKTPCADSPGFHPEYAPRVAPCLLHVHQRGPAGRCGVGGRCERSGPAPAAGGGRHGRYRAAARHERRRSRGCHGG